MDAAVLFGGVITLFAGVFVFLHASLHVRVSALLFVLLSGVLSFLGVSGALGALVVLFMLRDANAIFRAWSRERLFWCLLTIGVIIAIEPGTYAVSVAVGIMVAVYLSASVRAGGLAYAAWGGFLGALVFAARNLTAPVITVADRIDGGIAMIGRRILPGLDPNSAAAILLVGIACGVYLVVHHGRLVSLMTTVGLGVMTTSIVLMAARFAMLTAALSLLFLWLSKGNIFRKTMIAGLGFAGVSILLPLVEEGGSLARFAKLSGDADSRASIYSDWWRVISDQGLIFGVPPEVIAAQPVAPHNAVLEALAHFGLVGTLLLAGTTTLLLLPFRDAGWQLRVPALAVLGMGMIVGLLAQYTVWIALVLLNAQRGSAAGVGIETVPRSPDRARWRPASGYTRPGRAV